MEPFALERTAGFTLCVLSHNLLVALETVCYQAETFKWNVYEIHRERKVIIRNLPNNISPRESCHFQTTGFCKHDNKVLSTKTAANIKTIVNK